MTLMKVRRISLNRILCALGFFLSFQLHAQSPEENRADPQGAVNPSEGGSTPKHNTPKHNTEPLATISFESDKVWEAARWYIIGKWAVPYGVQWLGVRGGTRLPFPKHCLSKSAKVGEFLRPPQTASANRSGEILESGEWFAIEVSPSVDSEELLVRSGLYSQNNDCEVRVPISVAWNNKEGRIRPFLFLAPRSHRLHGFEIAIEAPLAGDEKPVDIQLELLLGFWKGSFPNAAELSNKSLAFAPVAIARGEWLPLGQYWGLSLALEQTVAAFGGAKLDNAVAQKALFSDWTVGSFGEWFLPVLDSLQLRAGLQYRQHLADDSVAAKTLASANKDAKYLIMAATSNLYFAQYGMAGFEIQYGLPSRLAGRGKTQSYLNLLGRFGFRTSTAMFILLEMGWRTYRTEDFQPENVFFSQAGISLSL